ncbi:hypothetical protein R3P38DRAFT_2920710 [Favolaschia claudopus]|uniref:Reverse transcriptase n=1 Tax=Favolaschia claudopus TaxID=2862362 RepID=A0AAW0C3E2_9AGAR
MTRLLLGDHNLSVERLRYPSRYRSAVPRDLRLCRFCRAEVEDEAHALLDCDAHARLRDLREELMQVAAKVDPGLYARRAGCTSLDFLIILLRSRALVHNVARFIYQVLNVYDGEPRFVPLVFRVP